MVQFMQEEGMVNLVKGFRKIQYYDISLFAGFRILSQLFHELQQLGFAGSFTSKAVLCGWKDVVLL